MGTQKTIQTVSGSVVDVIKIQRAIISVSDKTGIVDLSRKLQRYGIELMSTGGTARAIRDARIPVTEVSDYTRFPEMLDGRVKTLHPAVHGGIMYVRGNEGHETSIWREGIKGIDLVIVNLYAFEATVAKGSNFETCVENVDIGGPSMLRASAKNHRYVTIVTSPAQYGELEAALEKTGGGTPYALRRKLAAAAFAHSASYEAAISSWFASQLEESSQHELLVRASSKTLGLKYGCNPYQQPAALYAPIGSKAPFVVRNGAPGYINMLDALNAYQLVKELSAACALPAAASFKHVSPAGAGLGVALSEAEFEAYEAHIHAEHLTPLATAYIRARQADPMCSFGDFVALSDVVDLSTAKVLQKEVSDGIIAPGYHEEALQVLSAKKGGKFVCIELDPTYEPAHEVEYREVYGVGFSQRRNDRAISIKDLEHIVTKATFIPDEKKRDLLLASIACKYTQSNSVAFAINGQLVGVGAGQQSRVDCVKLAARKVQTWWLRQAPAVMALPFKDGTKRQERVNARVRFIEGNLASMPQHENEAFNSLFYETVLELPAQDRNDHMAKLSGVCLASDAFFPFRDNIDVAAQYGVSFVAQAGGSVQDENVVAACDQYGIAMTMTGLRLFHH